jgi:hypothetical protein
VRGRRVRLLIAAVTRVRRHVLLMTVNPRVGIEDAGVEGRVGIDNVFLPESSDLVGKLVEILPIERASIRLCVETVRSTIDLVEVWMPDLVNRFTQTDCASRPQIWSSA